MKNHSFRVVFGRTHHLTLMLRRRLLLGVPAFISPGISPAAALLPFAYQAIRTEAGPAL